MVYRIYVEKKPAVANEARSLLEVGRSLLGIQGLESVRVVNRYDVEGVTEEFFRYAVTNVFSEPQIDTVSETLQTDGCAVFAVEYLPGQFDQRADSAAQCLQIISQGERPRVKTARIYLLGGKLAEEDILRIKKHVINPVEAREATMERPLTLSENYEIPTEVATLTGFCQMDDAAIAAFLKEYGLAMDEDDLRFCRDYFRTEERDPTITEIRMIDTYWSDHCRHTTFLTTIDEVKTEDPLIQKTYDLYLDTRRELGRTKPVNLMDVATLAVRSLKKKGLLARLDESEEINACTVKVTVNVEGKDEEWLLLFKNETHNHPTEIEPFGGAATCIGGAIRDPLSGRSYVYAAMRVTGAGDPLTPIADTLPGKLPQRTIVTTAAAGYSSYGNQIGLATGIVDELYHPGYAAKRMEIGAVIAAAPAENVRRERPIPGDAVILLGGRTGRDGCGGATGSSKSHTEQSLTSCGAEVQKGNAPEERKLQRLFRRKDACRLIKRCNDFGAGGVSVAIGELADGLFIDLNKVPKKYEGLDGTELAISESQERMAVVVAKEDVEAFLGYAAEENLEATPVANVTEEARLTMVWNGKTIVDLSREFLNSNGAEKHMTVAPAPTADYQKPAVVDFAKGMKDLVSDLNVCSKEGLSERFDATIGAGTVLMPLGGTWQKTPIQAMVQKISVEEKHTDCCSFMAWGYNPYLSERSPYHGAYLAVVESVSKMIAAGASYDEVYLTFQEYFEKPGKDPARWGKPLSALLGAFRAQMEMGIGSIGGKDSMSGSFEKLDVPPTLVSFAVTTGKTSEVISGEFKKANSKVVLLSPEYGEDGLPKADSLIALYRKVTDLMRQGKVLAAYTPTYGGIAEAIFKMSLGNGFGFRFAEELSVSDLFSYHYGSFLLETEDETLGTLVGQVVSEDIFAKGDTVLSKSELFRDYEDKLASVYPFQVKNEGEAETFAYEAKERKAPAIKVAKPRVLIPVFPGTNCEYDSAKAVRDAGAEPSIFVINNLSSEGITRSVENFAKELAASQMVFVPGGFSGGDEPDGSGKFITAFFRNEAVKAGVTDLLEKRDGLMLGICNGFQALIKLGLVPYGKIVDAEEKAPTLTFNTVARHVSRMVRIRVSSNKSPWLAGTQVGEVYTVPVSHGEGRFLADEALIRSLAANGQIATQYANLSGDASMDCLYNPNGSVLAVEGITSPDGRVFGKMGHSERIGNGLYRNVVGEYDMKLFASAVKYFKG